MYKICINNVYENVEKPSWWIDDWRTFFKLDFYANFLAIDKVYCRIDVGSAPSVAFS